MIGGNVTAYLQTKDTVKNAIGEAVPSWTTRIMIKGFLDFANGDSRRTVYNAKIQESTHYFICDYFVPAYSYKPTPESESVTVPMTPENSRMVINDKTYDVTLIDNPMELNQHMEIYLKYTGGQ